MGFGLPARFFAIGSSALLGLWLVLISFFYWSNDLSQIETRLPTGQLTAIVELVDATPASQRPQVLHALDSVILSVALLPGKDQPRPAEELRDDADFSAYRAAIGERLLSVHNVDTTDGMMRSRSLRQTARPLVFVIAMGGDQVLVISARTPFIVMFFGLPAGVGGGLFGTLFAFVAFVMLHREIRPLTRLAKALDAIDPSGELVPLPVIRSTTPEIRALIRAFEQLQSRLRVMTRSRMALFGGIQHDVRSFATRLRLRLERLPDANERERATADINDMIDLLDNALLTSRAGVGALDEEMLDIADLLRSEMADLCRADLPARLEAIHCRGEAWIIGDRLALRRMIGNIIDNAVKYGQFAHVSLTADEQTIRVMIEDNGPGFVQGNEELLLEPFVRAEPSRARATGGAGLGLAVARTLVEAQGGTIDLGNGRRGGLVTLSLPRFVPD
ncbi:HAMP domain-containing sensor histidine kinase [Rhizobium sp. FY34]|uniref:sensor histidine kinase n=1 Tax=Rhizobium sp. FY34 TaxID=2562309 RepID=UPI001FEE55CB|nr:HAMP domain-containing sensor histidine kinase [Rhizobium sp. FY34]